MDYHLCLACVSSLNDAVSIILCLLFLARCSVTLHLIYINGQLLPKVVSDLFPPLHVLLPLVPGPAMRKLQHVLVQQTNLKELTLVLILPVSQSASAWASAVPSCAAKGPEHEFGAVAGDQEEPFQ